VKELHGFSLSLSLSLSRLSDVGYTFVSTSRDVPQNPKFDQTLTFAEMIVFYSWIYIHKSYSSNIITLRNKKCQAYRISQGFFNEFRVNFFK